MHTEKKKHMNVSNLIRKFNIIINIRRDHRFSKSCPCMFRLYGNKDDIGDEQICPVHRCKDDYTSDTILKNFVHKNIVYINTMSYERILYDV